jgi:hypothetical protein
MESPIKATSGMFSTLVVVAFLLASDCCHASDCFWGIRMKTKERRTKTATNAMKI